MDQEFQTVLDTKTDRVNRLLESFLPKEEGCQKTIFEAVNYSILAGGKRLRPLFMEACFLLFSEGDPDRETAAEILSHFMAAIEMIHTYSLVHDDLPAMDNDLYRRGKPTTHAKYGEAMGILAGDGLLNLAFETAAAAYGHITEPSCTLYQRLIRAMAILGRKSGIYGMAGGQAVDVEKSGQAVDSDTLQFIYAMKTSALIEASMLIGAVLAGAAAETLEKLEAAARRIGLAFQMQDDVLDIIGSAAAIGKPVHSDERNAKTTYASLHGIAAAKAESERLSNEAQDILHEVLQNAEIQEEKQFFFALLRSLLDRKA